MINNVLGLIFHFGKARTGELDVTDDHKDSSNGSGALGNTEGKEQKIGQIKLITHRAQCYQCDKVQLSCLKQGTETQAQGDYGALGLPKAKTKYISLPLHATIAALNAATVGTVSEYPGKPIAVQCVAAHHRKWSLRPCSSEDASGVVFGNGRP